MNKYGLQNFIEQNVGKRFGDKYLLGDVFLNTRFCRQTKPEIIEVSLNLPWMTFSDCLDTYKVTNNIEFYDWLIKTFIPLAEKRITKG